MCDSFSAPSISFLTCYRRSNLTFSSDFSFTRLPAKHYRTQNGVLLCFYVTKAHRSAFRNTYPVRFFNAYHMFYTSLYLTPAQCYPLSKTTMNRCKIAPSKPPHRTDIFAQRVQIIHRNINLHFSQLSQPSYSFPFYFFITSHTSPSQPPLIT